MRNSAGINPTKSHYMSYNSIPVEQKNAVCVIILNPKIIALAGMAAMILLAWAYLVLVAGQTMALSPMPVATAVSNKLYTISLLSSMWVAMAIAMMLPTAMPMISAYVQICQTASAKSIATVSPLVLIAGYLSVWLVFALSAAIVQTGLIGLMQLSPATVATQGVASVLLLGAGFYQFTNLKQACLTKCRAPLNFFFANWSDRRREIFQLGVKQGLFCLGCCWALMLVMFVTGIMNILWMVALSALMVAEKTIPNPDVLRRITGFALIAWGATLGIELF